MLKNKQMGRNVLLLLLLQCWIFFNDLLQSPGPSFGFHCSPAVDIHLPFSAHSFSYCWRRYISSRPCARQTDRQTDRPTDRHTDRQTHERHPRIVSVSRVTSPPLSPCAVWRCGAVVEPLAASCWRSARLFQYWEDHGRVRTADTQRPGKCLRY